MSRVAATPQRDRNNEKTGSKGGDKSETVHRTRTPAGTKVQQIPFKVMGKRDKDKKKKKEETPKEKIEKEEETGENKEPEQDGERMKQMMEMQEKMEKMKKELKS